jgi:stage II sporulation protein D
MRRLLTITVLGMTLALAGAASAQTFSFSGHGYGHGVGMSQWGAQGFAKHGWTYDRILAHYYTGTTLGPAPVTRIRVLLASGRSNVTISSDAPFTVSDAAGEVRVPAGSLTIRSDLSVTVGGKTRSLESPVRVEPDGAPLEFDRAYRGALLVHRVDGSLSVVNDVKLEDYVAAVVPHEMPPTWHPEALKVQAVAARTYAIVVRKPGSYYDFKSDPVGQAYEGVSEEDPRTTAAVQATKGTIVLYGGKPAWTFYSSSSGGRTAALADVFSGGGADYPYLVPVDDPYDDISPYHDWGPVVFTGEELAAKLRLPAPPTSLRVRLTESGRVSTLVARGPGWTKEIRGPIVRTSLGLRSTWFRVSGQQPQDGRTASLRQPA